MAYYLINNYYLYKSLEEFHAVFNINVGEGDVDGRGADVGVAKDTAT